MKYSLYENKRIANYALFPNLKNYQSILDPVYINISEMDNNVSQKKKNPQY